VYTKSGINRFRPDWPEVFNHTIAALLAAVILAVFGTLGLLRPVRIPADRADEFFLNYFNKVPASSQRHSIYDNDFTSAFRSYHVWSSYNSFWEPVSYVDIDQAIPISDNPLELTVNATFYPVSGPSWQQSFDYYLTCDGTIDKLYARIMQCPASHIEIDRVVWLDPGPS